MAAHIFTLILLTALVGLSQQQTCNTQPGKDITAPNLRQVNGVPEFQCCGLCSQTSGCRAYAWNDYQGGTCWLKGSTGPITDNGGSNIGVMDGAGDEFRVVAFYYGTWDVGHISFTREAQRFFPSWQAEHGFVYEGTTDWSKLNDNYLANVDVIMFLDDRPQNANHRQVVQRFVERGGGALFFHVSAFTHNSGEWPWYHNTLLGSGNHVRNTWFPTPAVLQVEDRNHPATKNLPATYTAPHCEWYAWANDLRQNPAINILMSVHPSSFPLGTQPGETWYEGYFPIVWTNRNYKVMYVNMGHNHVDYNNGNADLSSTFSSDVQNRFFTDALKWLAGRSTLDSKPENPLLKAFGV